MFANAIVKLKTEIDQHRKDMFIKVVGEYLIQYIEANPEAAEKILSTDKTIAKSVDAMAKEAAKRKVGDHATIIDYEGFEIVLKYFGIAPGASIEPISVKKSENDSFDIKLEDLI